MHRKRVITAAILALASLAVLSKGGHSGEMAFLFMVIAATALCLREYFAITFPCPNAVGRLGIIIGLLPVVCAIINPEPGAIAAGLYLALFSSILIFIPSVKIWPNPLLNWAAFLMGASYIGLCAAHLVLIRSLEAGREWVFFLFCVIFAGDVGAYYTGSAVGRHKLCPVLSKGKTIEGAAGGLVSSVIVGSGAGALLFNRTSPIFIGALAAALGITGQIGDLTESLVKRSFGVKDSGSLLPGHGGIFDRIDALLMATPMMYWILQLTEKYGLFQ
ncbi:MAG: phosphatidate cytidylyltransferase [Dissulfurimicrobium sp.]|uniref:phosphatidate cytidylyltransferase n=1 Tax=Dissulfurimicrobium TaxID=1769732 RepID=UPI001EDC82B5|nr:phosphatidate cytidylyltransferase [Dissulfurimicrobium hydrothermale]UKL14383.1 phosphatidate cytidylyltransferase [Dissulfurimicrobium hydrothermale]